MYQFTLNVFMVIPSTAILLAVLNYKLWRYYPLDLDDKSAAWICRIALFIVTLILIEACGSYLDTQAAKGHHVTILRAK